MTWYLAQYNGQWGYVRADLVRVMGDAETKEYLAALEAAQATPTPMPQATPEPLGPDAKALEPQRGQGQRRSRRWQG